MNLDILLFFQSIRSDPLDAVMSAVTWLGSETVFVPVLCVILWCVRKELGYRLGLTLFLTAGLTQTLKVLFAVPRPWIRWPNRVAPVPSAVTDATGYSFPSGHTCTAATIYPTLAMRAFVTRQDDRGARRRKAAIGCGAALAVVLVGVSRVYLGVHTPADVVVSALLTLAVVVPANLLYDRIEQGRIPDAAVLAGGFTLAAVVLAIASAVLAYGRPDAAEQTLDAFKAAGAMAGFVAGWYVERRWIRFDIRASLPVQGIKAAAGILVLLGVQAGMKPVLQGLIASEPAADALRYLLVALWATCGLPAAAVWSARVLRRAPRRG